MKIFIKCKNNQLGNQTELLLKSDVLAKGHSIAKNILDADEIWYQVKDLTY